jgi:endonuclease-3
MSPRSPRRAGRAPAGFPVKEDPGKKRIRGKSVLRTLRKEFPSAHTALRHENPFQLVVATILSAQCTDVRVNMVTKDLFRKYPAAADLASVLQPELEKEIRSTGFYRMKAKNVIACSRALIERFGGNVPQNMEDLVSLPGVGRKTANVVLGQAFGITSGVVVDTHVHRLARRLGFTKEDTPEKIEADLMDLFPKKDWIDLGTVLILHGRKTCNARKPDCPACPVSDRCPSSAL